MINNNKRNSLLSVRFTVCILIIMLLTACGTKQQESQLENYYRVYVGLNDVDSGKQEVSLEDARRVIQDIITKKGFGFTEYCAYGAYTEDGAVNKNDTLVYTLLQINKDEAADVASVIKKELNLDSVLVEEAAANLEFVE